MAKNLQAGLRQSIKASSKAGVTGAGIFSLAPLDLRFALQKTLDPRVTFTRASTGTFVGSDGLLQSAVTNLLLRSEEFDNASWNKALTTVSPNAISAPNGTTTADKLEETSGTGEHLVWQVRTGFSETLTLSVFCKQAERTRVRLGFSNFATEATGAVYDLVSGTVVSTSASGVDYTNPSASISAFGNGWFRCVFTATKGIVNTTNNSFIETVTGTSFSFTGTAGSGIYLWGAQLEAASTAGEYIPTTSTINSAPRFDHNPTTGESLGLLVEEARTNLALYSQAINLTNWGLQQATTQTLNAATSPDGSSNATLIVENTQNANRFIAQTVAVTNAAYTVSVFAKAKERKRIMFREDTTSGTSATFDLQTGTVAGSEGSPTTSIQSYGNGWYRCVMTYTPSSSSSRIHAVYVMPDSGTSFATSTYTGDGASGLFLFGFQVELGAGLPTSYIPTTTATATRAADVANSTGTAFSSWYNQTEGTVFADGSTSWAAGNFVGSSDNTNNNRIFIGVASGPASRLLITTSGSSAAAITVPYALNTLLRGAGGYKENSSQFAANGALGTEDTNCTIPTVNKLSIGSNTTSSDFFLNGTIKRLTYWPVRLANPTLQAITQP